ncbi:MAG: L,D-transpeptidase family protein [Rhodocyclaceae bacterium]|nr:L,D-transpeptidase family protein [Rhodocyclaceae bacterium]
MSRALAGPLICLAWLGAAQAGPVQEALAAQSGGDGEVAAFYARRDFQLAWTDTGKVAALAALVKDAASHGLDPADYGGEALTAQPVGADAATLAARDRRLTLALARLVRHLAQGKVDPRRLYPEWNFLAPLGGAGSAEELERLLQASDLFAAVAARAPVSADYQGLRRALAHYRALALAGGWTRLAEGPSLKPGMGDVSRVPALRARLALEGDHPPPEGDPARLDPPLAEAVGRFQVRHGLEPDGAVGKRTLAALNVPVEARIDQIRVNLERLRWLDEERAGDRLEVDIAGFAARLYLDGQLAWDSRVVVGRPYRKTPAFRADMRYLVLNPPWVVPPTILREDVLPKLAKDTAYLAAHEMRVVDGAGKTVAAEGIDWNRYRHGGFPHQIVQVPGPDNPLGRIKFMLPNPHAIYLHDTPSRRLFQRTERAHSSGCVRLEKPLELAVLMLNDPQRWSREALEAELATGRTRHVAVGRDVPVLVLYFTAQADETAGVSFRPDLYGRDPVVLEALSRP